MKGSLFICRITLTERCLKEGLPADFMDIIAEHARYLDDLGREGKLIFAGRTQVEPVTDRANYGLVLFSDHSIQNVHLLRENDPAVKRHVQQWELLPFSMGIRHLYNLE